MTAGWAKAPGARGRSVGRRRVNCSAAGTIRQNRGLRCRLQASVANRKLQRLSRGVATAQPVVQNPGFSRENPGSNTLVTNAGRVGPGGVGLARYLNATGFWAPRAAAWPYSTCAGLPRDPLRFRHLRRTHVQVYAGIGYPHVTRVASTRFPTPGCFAINLR